jgi:hypothetical protein
MALVQVLWQCGDDLTRENVMRQAAHLDMQLPMVLPGIRLSTSPKQYFPLRGMQLMIFKGDRWEGLGEIMGAE